MTEASNISFGSPAGGARVGFRWFGPETDVPIGMISQIPGVTDIVSALHHVPNGNEWTVGEILKRKIEVEFKGKVEEPANLDGTSRDTFYMDSYRNLIKSGTRTNLTWSTIESLPFTEEIKNGSPLRDQHIETYKKSLANIGMINRLLEEPAVAAAGGRNYQFKSVMGNFMLVADWTRTGNLSLHDGSNTLEYNHTHFAAFDIFMAKRHKHLEDYVKDGSYTKEQVSEAEAYWDTSLKKDRAKQESLANMIVAGLPGAQASFGPGASVETKLDIFREAVGKYKDMTVAQLRDNIDHFLTRVVPEAKKAGVVLCSHPDDPAFSPFLGTPRAVGDVEGYKFLLDRGCGVGLCFGSLTPNKRNCNVMGFVQEIAEHGLSKEMKISEIFPHVHLRPIERTGSNFREGRHADNVQELSQVIYALRSYGWGKDGNVVFRPDHAPDPTVLHDMVEKATGSKTALGGRGYSIPGRAMGANLLIGVFAAIDAELNKDLYRLDSLIENGLLPASQREQGLNVMRKAAFNAMKDGNAFSEGGAASPPSIIYSPTTLKQSVPGQHAAEPRCLTH